LLNDGEKVFDPGGPDDAKEERLLKENADLKRMIGELPVELKKRRGVVLKHRKRSSRIDQADAELLPHIREIKAAHPLWGYRSVWSYLRYREQIIIGKNRVYRIPVTVKVVVR
jgi:hypothetical protein